MIDDDDIVYRRIRPNWVKSFEPFALSSEAFQNLEDNNMSGHLDSLLQDNDLTPESLLDGFDGYGLVWLRVKYLRELGQEVVAHIDDEDDPAHVHVSGAKSKGTKRSMARVASENVLVLPDKK